MAARTAGDVDARIEAALRRVEALLANNTAGLRAEMADAAGALRAELRGAESRLAPPDAEAVTADVAVRMAAAQPWQDNLYVPDLTIAAPGGGAFMPWSTCSAADFRHPDFAALCGEMGHHPSFHRKLWEFVFIAHHLRRLGRLQPGRHGLVFGVGQEPLPSLFARLGARVTATDAPPEIGLAAGWHKTHEYAATLEAIRNHAIVDADTFNRLVTYQPCDMTAIDPALTGFDFCWSACSLEHLGSLEAGLDFIVESVERCLKPGGVAVHTTELNLSSDVDTPTAGPTVLYRRRDLAGLVDRLRARGHAADAFTVAPDTDPLDFYVDVPPYRHNPHLKLRLQGYCCTSAGVVVRRG